MKIKKRHILSLLFCSIIFITAIILFSLHQNNPYEVSSYTLDYLNTCGITQYQISNLPDYQDYHLEKNTISISEEEVENHLHSLLDSYSYMEPITERDHVQIDDFVTISYTVTENGKEIQAVSGDILKVGAGYYNKQLEKLLPGNVLNQPFHCTIDSIFEDGTTHTLQYEVLIHSIARYVVPTLTASFLKENFNVNSEQELYKLAKKTLLNEKEGLAKKEAEKKLLRSLAAKSTIQLEEEEVAHYATSIVRTHQQLASAANMSLEDYTATKLNLPEDQFYQYCYDEAYTELSLELVIGAIAKKEKLTITNQELEAYQQANENTEQTAIVQFLLREKVLKLFY